MVAIVARTYRPHRTAASAWRASSTPVNVAVMRIAFAAAFLAIAVSAHAEEGRFALSPSRDGIVRLDTATGATSHCAPVKGVWRCAPLQFESNRLDALATEVAALTARVAALNARVAALPQMQEAIPTPPEQPSVLAEPRPNFMREALGRFLDLVRTLKHGREA
jgi:hypothetical protein